MVVPLPRRLLAEYLGSLLLAALVVGSGIAAQTLSPGDVGLQLAENAAATAAGLFAIILIFGPVSGGHFNPVVSLADAALGGLPVRDALAYLPAQVAGCVSGAVMANLMFDAGAVSLSETERATAAHGLSEVVATVPPASQTRRSPSGACSPTPSRASNRPRCPPTCSHRRVAERWPCCSCGSSTPQAPPAMRTPCFPERSPADEPTQRAVRVRALSTEAVQGCDVVVTMGCGDACPIYPGKRYEDWALTDPAGQPIEVVRAVRDEIGEQVRALLADLL